MNSALAVLILLTVLSLAAFQVWLIVIAVRFLRSGRKAFDRYLHVTDTPRPVSAPGNTPHTPGWASSADPYPRSSHHQSGA